MNWNNALPFHYEEEWNKLEEEYEKVVSTRIYKRVLDGDTEMQQLHIYCDVSFKAFIAAANYANESGS